MLHLGSRTDNECRTQLSLNYSTAVAMWKKGQLTKITGLVARQHSSCAKSSSEKLSDKSIGRVQLCCGHEHSLEE